MENEFSLLFLLHSAAGHSHDPHEISLQSRTLRVILQGQV